MEIAESWQVESRAMVDEGAPLDLSLVELVLLACEWSEDETEVADLVDGLIGDGRVRSQPPCH